MYIVFVILSGVTRVCAFRMYLRMSDPPVRFQSAARHIRVDHQVADATDNIRRTLRAAGLASGGHRGRERTEHVSAQEFLQGEIQ